MGDAPEVVRSFEPTPEGLRAAAKACRVYGRAQRLRPLPVTDLWTAWEGDLESFWACLEAAVDDKVLSWVWPPRKIAPWPAREAIWDLFWEGLADGLPTERLPADARDEVTWHKLPGLPCLGDGLVDQLGVGPRDTPLDRLGLHVEYPSDREATWVETLASHAKALPIIGESEVEKVLWAVAEDEDDRRSGMTHEAVAGWFGLTSGQQEDTLQAVLSELKQSGAVFTRGRGKQRRYCPPVGYHARKDDPFSIYLEFWSDQEPGHEVSQQDIADAKGRARGGTEQGHLDVLVKAGAITKGNEGYRATGWSPFAWVAAHVAWMETHDQPVNVSRLLTRLEPQAAAKDLSSKHRRDAIRWAIDQRWLQVDGEDDRDPTKPLRLKEKLAIRTQAWLRLGRCRDCGQPWGDGELRLEHEPKEDAPWSYVVHARCPQDAPEHPKRAGLDWLDRSRARELRKQTWCEVCRGPLEAITFQDVIDTGGLGNHPFSVVADRIAWIQHLVRSANLPLDVPLGSDPEAAFEQAVTADTYQQRAHGLARLAKYLLATELQSKPSRVQWLAAVRRLGTLAPPDPVWGEHRILAEREPEELMEDLARVLGRARGPPGVSGPVRFQDGAFVHPACAADA